MTDPRRLDIVERVLVPVEELEDIRLALELLGLLLDEMAEQLRALAEQGIR